MLANLDAEAELIGALLAENSLFDVVADELEAHDFAAPVLSRVYEIALAEFSAGRSANPITLKPYIEADKEAQALGGAAYLMELTANAGFSNARDIARQVADLARRRRIDTGLEQAQNLCADMSRSHAEIVACADDAITAHGKDFVHQPTGRECFDEMIEGFAEKALGASCGSIPSLDRVLGPLRPKQLVIGAGRPGMGKTAVALSYSLGAARNGHGVLFVSLEMSSRELAQRLASDLCYDRDPIQFASIRDANLSQAQHKLLREARDFMGELPFQVIDAGSLTTGRLSSLIRRHKRRMEANGQKLELVVVDYLQLLSPDRRCNSNYEAVSEVSRALKAMAKDNDVAVLALAQLSREVEKRPDRRPMLSDLRDSGQIEQDADAVLFLLREEYYLRKEEPEPSHKDRLDWEAAMADARDKIEFIVAKRRNGVEGSAIGNFFGQFQAVRG